MLVEFDPAKDAANVAKRGVSLAAANALDWASALVWVDARFEYNESRIVVLVPKTGVLYDVAFVDRGSTRKIISLCRANRREVRRYVQDL